MCLYPEKIFSFVSLTVFSKKIPKKSALFRVHKVRTCLKYVGVTSRDYIFHFSQWYATVLLIFAPNFKREGARQGCGAYERDRGNNYFFIILIYLNEHKHFYSRIQQSLKFILIYNFEFTFEFFLFLFTSSIALIDARSWLLFSNVILFYFRSWSWSSFQVQLNLIISFSLICTTSSRSVFYYGEFPNVSKNCICGISELQELPQW